MARPKVDYTDREFHDWTVLGPTDRPKWWLCRCKCGNEKPVHITSLRAGSSTRCRDCANRSPAALEQRRRAQKSATAASAAKTRKGSAALRNSHFGRPIVRALCDRAETDKWTVERLIAELRTLTGPDHNPNTSNGD